MRHIVTAQSILRGTRKFSFALGTLLALCLMAFGALGNVASAHTSSRHPNVIVLSHVQLNVLSCNQIAASKAVYKAGNRTKQVQVCIFAQKNVSKNHKHVGPTDLMTTIPSRGSKGHRSTVIVLSHVQINVLSCNQIAASKAVYKAGNRTKQVQICIFAQKNVSKSHKNH